MLRDKTAAAIAALIAYGCWMEPAKAADKGGQGSGILPIGEMAAAATSTPWTGFYVGAHGGYGWSAFDGSMIYTDASPGDGFDASGKTIKGEGELAGGQIGFNWQTGAIVWGVEADASWARIEGDARLLPYPTYAGSPAWDFNTSIEWLATVRGRVGYTYGRTLVYATGGVAFAGVETNLNVVGEGYKAWGSKSENLTGWTVGGGFEWLLAQNWTLRAEYLYVNLGDVGGILPGEQMTSCNPACAHKTDGFGGDLDIHVVRGAINYKF